MFDIARAVEAGGLGPAADFLKVAQSDTFIVSDIAPSARSLEGYLFPDTYEFSRMQTMREIAAGMVREFRQTARQIGLVQTPGSETAGSEASTSTSSVRIVAETEIERTVIMASI